jgi:hypothetical protein
METCPACGCPLERADDFWYCDNPDCPRPKEEQDEGSQTDGSRDLD